MEGAEMFTKTAIHRTANRKNERKGEEMNPH